MSNTSKVPNDRPYPARQGQLPRQLDTITAEFLTSLLSHRYPGIEVYDFKVVELKNSHTTKLRVELNLKENAASADLPRNVCLKSNWSEGFESGDICELEARFYHYPKCITQTGTVTEAVVALLPWKTLGSLTAALVTVRITWA
jgi:hypothetical protein